VNDYPLEKRRGITRLLFLGDSVTHRGFIIDALRRRLGESDFEYWNAGVEGYTTVQEVGYYRKWNHKVMPDGVLLTFHPNDFGLAHVILRKPSGEIVRIRNRESVRLNPLLLAHSRLYRLLVHLLGQRAFRREFGTAVAEVRTALRELGDMLARDSIDFTVLVLPWSAPPDDWSRHHRRCHRTAVEMMSELGIDSIDLLPALKIALRDGVDPQQTEGDRVHPSRALAGYYADAVLRHDRFVPMQEGTGRPRR
jgi:hypothetical protein